MEIRVEGISKESFFLRKKCVSAKVSPDGKFIAKIGKSIEIASVGRESSLIIESINTAEILQFAWSADSQKLLIASSKVLLGVNVSSGEVVCYLNRGSARLLKTSPNSNRAIVGISNKNPSFYDLYLLDIDTGDLQRILENDQYAQFVFTDKLEILLKVKISENGSLDVFTRNEKLFLSFNSTDSLGSEILSYDESDKSVYFLDNRFSNTSQLKKKSIISPFLEECLAEDIFNDIDDILWVDSKPKAYAVYGVERKWHLISEDIAENLSYLIKNLGHQFELINSSKDSYFWVLFTALPEEGECLFLYDRKKRLLEPLSEEKFSEYSRMYPMKISSRDHKELVCYYTLPKEYDKGGHLKDPLPLVVLPHSGPFKIRDKFEFNPYHQWLASCGYAVLSVNFRLSSGFGKEFVLAGREEWGKKAHLDVIDAVEACIEKGVARRDKIGIFGHSYGGYEALAALVWTPEYFTCGVSISAPTDFKKVLEKLPEYWEFFKKPLSDQMRFYTKQPFFESIGLDYLEKCSPINYLNQIQRPLLLVHGEEDIVISEEESKRMYESMKKEGKDVQYIYFAAAGHEFESDANMMLLLEQAELFFSKHLGGSYQAIDKELLVETTGTFYT